MSTPNLPITIAAGVDQTQVAVIPAAIARRDELLAIAKRGQRITSPESAARATTVLRDLKGFAKQIEDARLAVKAPVLELGRRIDTLAKELTAEVNGEATRIAKLVGAYETEQERIRREEQARQEAEARRLHEEAEAKERAAREEAARREAAAKEAAAKAAESGDAVAKANAERQAAEARAQGEKDAAAAKATADAQIAAQRAQLATTGKPEGLHTRADVDFEVTDILALYAANPSLVTLTPNRAALKEALKALPEGGTLPGVRHWQTAKAVVRTT